VLNSPNIVRPLARKGFNVGGPIYLSFRLVLTTGLWQLPSLRGPHHQTCTWPQYISCQTSFKEGLIILWERRLLSTIPFLQTGRSFAESLSHGTKQTRGSTRCCRHKQHVFFSTPKERRVLLVVVRTSAADSERQFS